MEEFFHKRFMKAILEEINKKDLPLYLKGGTSLLLLCHNSNRFSEDIDLNSNIKINLESIIQKVGKNLGIDNLIIKLVKDTNITKRYKILYNDKLLKIEISLRDFININEIEIINGIKTYKIETLIDMKFKAINGRLAARDFHDIVFLAKNYHKLFFEYQKQEFLNLYKDIEKIFSYENAYLEDSLLMKRFEKDLKLFEECIELLNENNLQKQEKTNKSKSIYQMKI